MWGLAWEVQDIEKAHQRLLDEGIEVTPYSKRREGKNFGCHRKISYPKCSYASYSAFKLNT
jgi:hypothetical protein